MPKSPAAVYVPNLRFRLRTALAEGKLAFIGVGGSIDGVINPTLRANEEDVVQIDLLNDDGIEHAATFPEFDAGTERVGQPAEQFANLTWAGFFIRNLFPVTLGNMVGGAVMVAAVYWFVYLREQPGNRLVRTWRHLGRSRVHADRAANDQDGEHANR